LKKEKDKVTPTNITPCKRERRPTLAGLERQKKADHAYPPPLGEGERRKKKNFVRNPTPTRSKEGKNETQRSSIKRKRRKEIRMVFCKAGQGTSRCKRECVAGGKGPRYGEERERKSRRFKRAGKEGWANIGVLQEGGPPSPYTEELVLTCGLGEREVR